MQFSGVVTFILINLASNIVGIVKTNDVNDNVDHFVYYLISQLLAITIIILSHKIEDCFHCFNCVQSVKYSQIQDNLSPSDDRVVRQSIDLYETRKFIKNFGGSIGVDTSVNLDDSVSAAQKGYPSTTTFPSMDVEDKKSINANFSVDSDQFDLMNSLNSQV